MPDESKRAMPILPEPEPVGPPGPWSPYPPVGSLEHFLRLIEILRHGSSKLPPCRAVLVNLRHFRVLRGVSTGLLPDVWKVRFYVDQHDLAPPDVTREFDADLDAATGIGITYREIVPLGTQNYGVAVLPVWRPLTLEVRGMVSIMRGLLQNRLPAASQTIVGVGRDLVLRGADARYAYELIYDVECAPTVQSEIPVTGILKHLHGTTLASGAVRSEYVPECGWVRGVMDFLTRRGFWIVDRYRSDGEEIVVFEGPRDVSKYLEEFVAKAVVPTAATSVHPSPES